MLADAEAHVAAHGADALDVPICIYVYIYIYIHREREIDRGRERDKEFTRLAETRLGSKYIKLP